MHNAVADISELSNMLSIVGIGKHRECSVLQAKFNVCSLCQAFALHHVSQEFIF